MNSAFLSVAIMWGLLFSDGRLEMHEEAPPQNIPAGAELVEVDAYDLTPPECVLLPALPLTYDRARRYAVKWQAEIDRQASEAALTEADINALRSDFNAGLSALTADIDHMQNLKTQISAFLARPDTDFNSIAKLTVRIRELAQAQQVVVADLQDLLKIQKQMVRIEGHRIKAAVPVD